MNPIVSQEHVEVERLERDEGFNGFGVFDLPKLQEPNLYRRQFFMGNREGAFFDDGKRVLSRALEGMTEVHYEGRPILHYLENDTEQFRFNLRGQEFIGGMSVRFHAGTGREINLYSPGEIPQDVTDKIWCAFEKWNQKAV